MRSLLKTGIDAVLKLLKKCAKHKKMIHSPGRSFNGSENPDDTCLPGFPRLLPARYGLLHLGDFT
jgi:hypothetical protein